MCFKEKKKKKRQCARRLELEQPILSKTLAFAEHSPIFTETAQPSREGWRRKVFSLILSDLQVLFKKHLFL